MEIVAPTETAPGQSDQTTRQRVARSILVNGPSTAADLAEREDLDRHPLLTGITLFWQLYRQRAFR